MEQVRLAFSDPYSSFALFPTPDGWPAPTIQVIASRYSFSIPFKHQCPRKVAKFI